VFPLPESSGLPNEYFISEISETVVYLFRYFDHNLLHLAIAIYIGLKYQPLAIISQQIAIYLEKVGLS